MLTHEDSGVKSKHYPEFHQCVYCHTFLDPDRMKDHCPERPAIEHHDLEWWKTFIGSLPNDGKSIGRDYVNAILADLQHDREALLAKADRLAKEAHAAIETNRWREKTKQEGHAAIDAILEEGDTVLKTYTGTTNESHEVPQGSVPPSRESPAARLRSSEWWEDWIKGGAHETTCGVILRDWRQSDARKDSLLDGTTYRLNGRIDDMVREIDGVRNQNYDLRARIAAMKALALEAVRVAEARFSGDSLTLDTEMIGLSNSIEEASRG